MQPSKNTDFAYYYLTSLFPAIAIYHTHTYSPHIVTFNSDSCFACTNLPRVCVRVVYVCSVTCDQDTGHSFSKTSLDCHSIVRHKNKIIVFRRTYTSQAVSVVIRVRAYCASVISKIRYQRFELNKKRKKKRLNGIETCSFVCARCYGYSRSTVLVID